MATAFDSAFARLLLELCRYTYAAGFADRRNDDDAQDALATLRRVGGPTFGTPLILRGSPTSVACVASFPDRNVVAYMGTKTQFDTRENARASIRDWSRNFDALLVPFALTREQLGAAPGDSIDNANLGGRVHRGFLEELAVVQNLVIAELLRRGGKPRALYVTGHSQGGAEAALATRAFVAGGFSVAATYTFAAPRSGNSDFVASVSTELPVHRLEFGDDIVPHVPPTLIGKGAQDIARSLLDLPLLGNDAKELLNFLAQTNTHNSFQALGTLCYGSNKTRGLRVDLSRDDEAVLFNDRLWSLVRHPERWAEHHHLAGTTEETKAGLKGNYTALVSMFTAVT
jgi:Lipase (class 3)